jgi:hypothetical protein
LEDGRNNPEYGVAYRKANKDKRDAYFVKHRSEIRGKHRRMHLRDRESKFGERWKAFWLPLEKWCSIVDETVGRVRAKRGRRPSKADRDEMRRRYLANNPTADPNWLN